MISFKILPDREGVEEFLREQKPEFSGEDIYSEMEALLLGYMEMEGDEGGDEIAAAVSCGCLLVRICACDYAFLCPIPINEGASVSDAAEQIRKYAIKEELPLVFIDVYKDEVSQVSEPFRFVDVQAMDEEGETFAVSAVTEAGRLGGVPVVEGERISFDPITEGDIPEYARLCRHESVNKYYGNDYKEDFGEVPDTAFFGRMEYEVGAGVSMTFAIRYEGCFAGEASVFAFDYVGGARIGIRLLPEFWGKGIGSEALEMLLEVAAQMDLRRVSTAVKKANAPSIAMTGKYMTYKCDEGDTAVFEAVF